MYISSGRMNYMIIFTGQMELQKHMEDLDTALEDIEEGVRDREDELCSALDKAERFDNTFQVCKIFISEIVVLRICSFRISISRRVNYSLLHI